MELLDCAPPPERGGASHRLEQKGVDTWIAVDAVKYALAGIADDIEIITSDADLYPALEVIRETRSRGVLRYSIGRTTDELIFSADEAKPITILDVMGWMGLEQTQHVVGSRLDFRQVLETNLEGVQFSFGRNQNEFLVNRTDAMGNRMSLRTKSYLVVLNWLNDFGGYTPWRELDGRISHIKQA